MARANVGRGPAMEMEGVVIEVEPLDALDAVEDVEGVELVQALPGPHPLAQFRERLKSLEAEVLLAEQAYESKVQELTRQLAETMARLKDADSRDAERKAMLQDLLSKMK